MVLDNALQQCWDDARPELKALRSAPRVSFAQAAWAVSLDRLDTRHSIVTQDISLLGVGFWTIEAFVPGSRVVLAIELNGWERRRILCEIRRCRYIDQGFFAVGAKFEAITEDASASIPQEWIDWAKMPPARRRRLAGPQILSPELVPGVFSAPVPVAT